MGALCVSVVLVFVFVGVVGRGGGVSALGESGDGVGGGQRVLRREDDGDVLALRVVVRATLSQDGYHGVSAASASRPVARNSGPVKTHSDTAAIADGTPRFCEKISASPEEMSDCAEHEANAPRAKPVGRGDFMDAREAKEIGKWISQTGLANTHAAKAFDGLLEENNTDDEDFKETLSEPMVGKRDDGGYLSETRSVGPDSDFQKALRVYMGKGPRYGGRQRRSGDSTASEGSGGESEFQGSVRKMWMLGRDGGKREMRTRSV